jgi:very-short-patch-repair endonuclease
VRSDTEMKHLPQYSKTLVPIARMLRANMTDAERKLWASLRGNQLGVKFRRQVPFGRYVVDFYCPKARLIVELDGSQHHTIEGVRDDTERDNYLRQMGQEVLRYTNIEILQNENGVLQDILEHVRARIAITDSHSSHGTR